MGGIFLGWFNSGEFNLIIGPASIVPWPEGRGYYIFDLKLERHILFPGLMAGAIIN
jgi:hypothetical protein